MDAYTVEASTLRDVEWSMKLKSDREKLEVMVGLLDEQLRLIDAQLQAPEPGPNGPSNTTKAFTELRNMCWLARDVAAALSRRQWRWPGFK
jgi:hypothetical protein